MCARSSDWGVYGWWCLDCDHPYSDHRGDREAGFACQRPGCTCVVSGGEDDRTVGLNEDGFRARLRSHGLTFLDGSEP